MAQDAGYKLLYSHPEMVRDLLLGFVPGEWIEDADFSTLEHVNGSYVSESERQRHDDMVWRVRVRDRWLWVYLILEFQSEPDPWMAIRMMVYLGLLAQHLIREGELCEGRLPPILPLVLYNGLAEWKSPRDAGDCFVAPPKGLETFRPRLLYHLVDEARLKLHPSDSVRNFSEALFRLEHGQSVEDLRRVLQALDTMLRAPEQRSLRRAFGVWVKMLLRRKAPSSSISEIERINDIMEADSMLAERIEGWFDEAERRGVNKGRQEGRKEGLQQGEAMALRRLLGKRFGDLPPALTERIDKASLAQIEAWFDRAIDAPSLDAVFGADGEVA
ncbi:MAG: Rpn family recombination-promoting nuclease/putative transposase [Porticoccaceae bacterium]